MVHTTVVHTTVVHTTVVRGHRLSRITNGVALSFGLSLVRQRVGPAVKCADQAAGCGLEFRAKDSIDLGPPGLCRPFGEMLAHSAARGSCHNHYLLDDLEHTQCNRYILVSMHFAAQTIYLIFQRILSIFTQKQIKSCETDNFSETFAVPL